MTLTPVETLGIILAVAAGTQLTRWLPFWLFPEKKQPPAVVTYLGRVLPPAMMDCWWYTVCGTSPGCPPPTGRRS